MILIKCAMNSQAAIARSADIEGTLKVSRVGGKNVGFFSDLYIEITADCNAGCTYCCSPAEVLSKRRFLTDDDIMKIFVEVLGSQMVKDGYTFSGGEPFLRADLIKKINDKFGNGRFVTVLTNGTLLSQPDVLYALDSITEIRVSLDERSCPSK